MKTISLARLLLLTVSVLLVPPALAEEAPAPAEEKPAQEKPAPSALSVPDANVRMGSITADGVTLKDMQCSLKNAGFMALMMGPIVAKAVGSRLPKLRACAPKAASMRVRFTQVGKKTVDAAADTGTPAGDKCAVQVLRGMPGVVNGVCAVTIPLRK